MFKVYAPVMYYTPAAKDYCYETPKLGEKVEGDLLTLEQVVEVLTTLNDEAFYYDGSHYAWAYVATIGKNNTVIDVLKSDDFVKKYNVICKGLYTELK